MYKKLKKAKIIPKIELTLKGNVENEVIPSIARLSRLK